MQRTRGSSKEESPRVHQGYMSAPKNCALVVPGARDNITEMTAYTYEYDRFYVRDFYTRFDLFDFLFSDPV